MLCLCVVYSIIGVLGAFAYRIGSAICRLRFVFGNSMRSARFRRRPECAGPGGKPLLLRIFTLRFKCFFQCIRPPRGSGVKSGLAVCFASPTRCYRGGMSEPLQRCPRCGEWRSAKREPRAAVCRRCGYKDDIAAGSHLRWGENPGWCELGRDPGAEQHHVHLVASGRCPGWPRHNGEGICPRKPRENSRSLRPAECNRMSSIAAGERAARIETPAVGHGDSIERSGPNAGPSQSVLPSIVKRAGRPKISQAIYRTDRIAGQTDMRDEPVPH